jgi:hypothetical protein
MAYLWPPLHRRIVITPHTLAAFSAPQTQRRNCAATPPVARPCYLTRHRRVLHATPCIMHLLQCCTQEVFHFKDPTENFDFELFSERPRSERHDERIPESPSGPSGRGSQDVRARPPSPRCARRAACVDVPRASSERRCAAFARRCAPPAHHTPAPALHRGAWRKPACSTVIIETPSTRMRARAPRQPG